MGDASACMGSGCMNALVEILGVISTKYSDTSDVPAVHFTRKKKKSKMKKGWGWKLRQKDSGGTSLPPSSIWGELTGRRETDFLSSLIERDKGEWDGLWGPFQLKPTCGSMISTVSSLPHPSSFFSKEGFSVPFPASHFSLILGMLLLAAVS